MRNPLTGGQTDSAVSFVQFLWEECKPELEAMNQHDINRLADLVYAKNVRTCWQDPDPRNSREAATPKRDRKKKEDKKEEKRSKPREIVDLVRQRVVPQYNNPDAPDSHY